MIACLVIPAPHPIEGILCALGNEAQIAAHAIHNFLGRLQKAVAKAGNGEFSCAPRDKGSAWLLLGWMGGVSS